MPTFGLGCTPTTPDQRDFVVRFKLLAPLPKSVDLRSASLPILNQGPLGSCTGFGIGRAFRQLLKKNKLPLYQPSQLFIYYNERVLERTLHVDAGATIRSGMKVITSWGACDLDQWPYIVSNFRATPIPAAYKNAKSANHKAVQYQRVTSLMDIKAALASGLLVVIGFSVYSNFYSIRSNGIMPEPAGSMEGGHCVTIDGYDDATQRFICSNSWGTRFGHRGYFYMPYSYLNNVFDKWVIQK